MLKTILVLPDGTEISSGAGMINAIQSCTLTECVNDSAELTLGSTCSNALEVTLITPAGGLTLDAGLEVTVLKESGGVRQQAGLFTLEKPTKPTANTMKVTGYDRVSKLDKDLTAWLSGLAGWPYTLTTFAGMVCEACGLTFKETEVPNGAFLVNKFTRSSVTGRQLMQWLGEICCRFCRATPDGEIEFAWYTDSGMAIMPSGDMYYLQNSLTYEDYTTAEIEAVQIRMADGENGALWPAAEEGVNSYIITGNPILNLRITEELLPVLANIKGALAGVRYTPCKVSIPACLDIRAGNTVAVTDKNGKTFTAYVMTKTQAGQKDTLECTGSYRRDSSAAVNNQSAASSGEAAAQNAFAGMTHEQMFNKWTDGGRIQGFFSQDDVWVFNAAVGKVVNLLANVITAGILKSKDGKTFYLDLDKGILKMQASDFSVSGKTVEEISADKANDLLNNYAETVTKDIASLQAQIDGNITTWFGSNVPTESNEPASNWTTVELKNQHLGDLFYIVDNQEQGGLVYRWALLNGVYSWHLVEDVEVAKALQQAADAKDTADGKRRVFVNQPQPPYDVGDLWAQGGDGDLMRCNTSRASGSYVASDWGLASKYIDEETAGSIAQGKVDAQTAEQIFDKWTDGGRIKGIVAKDGVWVVNADIAKIINLIADHVLSESENSSVDISGAKIKFFNGNNETLAIENWENSGCIFLYDYNSGVCNSLGTLTGRSIFFQGDGGNPHSQLGLGIGADGLPWMTLPGEDVKDISWEYSEELGKYVLCGK